MAQLQDITGGIVINAGFFRIGADFTPTGAFNTDDYSSNNPLNPVYEPYFGAVVKTSDGWLDIVPLKETTKYKEFFTTGPILVKENWKFEPALFDTKDPATGTLIFTCNMGVPTDSLVGTCAGQPGDLMHASNLNPRTALGIKADGTVLLIYVEGRGSRGAGMDLAMLADLCVHYGAVKAINLDGGQSSQFVWKQPGSDMIEMSNPDHTYSYPVGTLLSYVIN
jgi:hypothetical protein